MSPHREPPPFKEEKLTIERLTHRWRRPAFWVRHELKQAGIRLVPVRRKPADGARLSDVLAFEQQVREGLISSGIRPNPPKDQDFRVLAAPDEKQLHEQEKYRTT
jgi:hypothetical protein